VPETPIVPARFAVPPARAARLEKLRGLYAIVDASSPQPPLSLVSAFIEGGATVIQLRLKNVGAGPLLAIARAAVALCHDAGRLLLVNDRPDVARLSGADGVHLGQEDLPVAAARALLGPDLVIGLSTHLDAELEPGCLSGADYLGYGPIFATTTRSKTDPTGAPLPPPHGLAGLQRACARATLPVVAIGGLTVESAAGVAAAGAACGAVISWLTAEGHDPAERARQYAAAFALGARS
jgi:thiamine-phosphate diphosphorylase